MLEVLLVQQVIPEDVSSGLVMCGPGSAWKPRLGGGLGFEKPWAEPWAKAAARLGLIHGFQK
jgi:hypothetical protein